MLHETGTVKELKKALPDIPSASLYRHIKILADCSILMVVDESSLYAGNGKGVSEFTVKWAIKNGVKEAFQEMKETEETK